MTNRIFALIAGIAMFLALSVPAAAQTAPEQRAGRFGLGVELGPHFGTADSTAFGLAFSGDYFLNHNFSIGPLVQFGVTDDLFHFGPSLQLKYTYDIDPRLKATLQGGVGFLYADLERRGRDLDDTGVLFPVGPGLEYRLTNDISLGSTLLFNFADNDVRRERFFVSLLGGLRVRF
jgi:hypothetical protein